MFYIHDRHATLRCINIGIDIDYMYSYTNGIPNPLVKSRNITLDIAIYKGENIIETTSLRLNDSIGLIDYAKDISKLLDIDSLILIYERLCTIDFPNIKKVFEQELLNRDLSELQKESIIKAMYQP